MRELTKKFNLFCMRNRDKGIPNLMLYIAIGNALVFLISMIDPSRTVSSLLYFSPEAIRAGQIWRLVTFLFVPTGGTGLLGGLFQFLLLFFYYRIGQILERTLGLCKFNLFYLFGVVLLDIFGVLLNMSIDVGSLNLSLLLAFAVAYPDGQVLLFYFIPLKVKYLAWFYGALTVVNIILLRSFTPVIPILNFLLFFWEDLPRLLPDGVHIPKKEAKARSDAWASAYKKQQKTGPYHHKCTVCGITDLDDPQMEFRYCSRCKGYFCYCMNHINNHTHIQ